MKNILVLWVILTAFIITGCGSGDGGNQTSNKGQTERPVFEVKAYSYSFMAPDTIPSGWITLRFSNARGMEIHELGLAKLPEGKNIGNYLREIFPVWKSTLQKAQNGEIEDDEIRSVALETLPTWNSEIQYVKSRGIISGGHQVENMIHLEPGTYIIECWIKNENGEIHISRGMVRPLTVTDTGNNATAPEADYEISLTTEGIDISEELTPGKHIFSLDFEQSENDQLIYDDIHLIRMTEETDLASVSDWMSWYKVGGLRAPAPAEFLGGADVHGSTPEGGKAYFSMDVQPGRYAWVVDAPSKEQIWREFTVSPQD